MKDKNGNRIPIKLIFKAGTWLVDSIVKLIEAGKEKKARKKQEREDRKLEQEQAQEQDIQPEEVQEEEQEGETGRLSHSTVIQ